MQLETQYKALLDEALGRAGQRSTKQREHIFALLLSKRDHPTADEIYARAKSDMPTISLATVYNCLEILVESELIRQVNFEREPTRYCPNLSQHAHFYCKETGTVHDIHLPEDLLGQLKDVLPQGYVVEHVEIAFNGSSPQSAAPRN